MLIRNLYYLYGNSESSNARLDSAIPNAIEEKAGTLIIPKRFRECIQKLASYCGVKLKSGLCIEIEQNEMLRILPHECRRENKKVFIPMFGDMTSLNVSIAGSILMYEVKMKKELLNK